MIDYADFADTVQMATGCSADPAILAAVREAAITTFRETKLWHTDLDAITERAGQTRYNLSSPSETRISGIQVVLRNGEPLEAVGRASLESTFNEEGIPTGFYRDGALIYINRIPKIPTKLIVHAVLEPTSDSAGIDNDDMAEAAWDAIKAKACELLCRMPRKSWADAMGAAGFERQYMQRAIELRREALKYTDGRLQKIENAPTYGDYSRPARGY